jgi:Ni,Fe-hydrogenase III large subunit
MFKQCFALRERVMDVLEAISGNRVNYAMNRIGGVNRDITDHESVMRAVREIREEVGRTLIPIFTTDRTVRARCAGVGVLTREEAIRMGALGPVARASGVVGDLRKLASYAAYDELEFDVPVESGGDVAARIVVRALEMLESCRLVEQALARMPVGPIHCGDFPAVPTGFAVARVEAPRGEVLYYVESDGSDTPTRVKIRTPSFMNIPTVRLMIRGASLADVPLIQASVDPCYSCTDR